MWPLPHASQPVPGLVVPSHPTSNDAGRSNTRSKDTGSLMAASWGLGTGCPPDPVLGVDCETFAHETAATTTNGQPQRNNIRPVPTRMSCREPAWLGQVFAPGGRGGARRGGGAGAGRAGGGGPD